MYAKLGVSDRLELALYCLHHHVRKKANDTVPATGEASNAAIEAKPQKTRPIKLPA